MKRPFVVFLSVMLPLAGIGCDRRSTADMILKIGATWLSQAEEPSRRPEVARRLAAAARDVRHIEEILLTCEKLGTELHHLRNVPPRRAALPADDARLRSRMDHVAEALEALTAELGGAQGLASQVREVQLAAFAWAAQQDPVYARQRDDVCFTSFGRAYEKSSLARISTQRFVGNYLASPETAAEAAIALTLHTLAYPECDANVALYVTVVDRLVSQGDAPVAGLVGQNGLRLLEAQPQARLLRTRLAMLGDLNGSAARSPSATAFRSEKVAGGSSGPAAAWGALP